MTSRPAPALVVYRTAVLMILSFVASANGNVLPQIFYQRHYPDEKALLLGACLFAGTIAATAGVLASRRSAARTPATLAALAFVLTAEGALFFVRGAVVYVALNALAQLGGNWLNNRLDHAALAAAGERRRLHDGAVNVVRLLGMLTAPVIFTAFYDRRGVLLSVLVGCAVLGLGSAASVLAASAPGSASPGTTTEGAPLSRADRLVLGYATALYVALYLLAANMIYLLRDVLEMDRAEQRGGVAILLVFSSALVGTALAATYRARRPPRPTRIRGLAAPAALLPPAAAILSRGAGLPFAAVVGGAVAIGLSVGVFIAELRDHASRGAREQGKTALLTRFNNVPNVSALLASATMVALAAACRGTAAGPYPYVLGVVGALPPVATALLFLGWRASVPQRTG
jgi:hypothetical protein